MVPDESNVINEEIKTAITKLKETKERRWSIIKQKFFEKYENCGEEEEDDGYEKYLAIEHTLPAERVNLVTTNKSDRGAWIEQEFIAPELKPYHEEAERLRHDIEDKIKTLNLMVISNNPSESDPIETEKQDSATPEPTLIDTDTCSSSVMGSPKKQVKKKMKKTVASTSKGKKTLKPGNSNPKNLLLDSSASEKKGSKRNVQDEELELALNKLQENKMRRWAIIKQKFFEKYEKVGENSKECGGTGHRNYQSLGQEANLAYISDDVVEYHNEAIKLREFIEGKVLTLKPYQAKLKNKKKAQENKDCAEETMEKIIKATLQFQKKCSLNGDPIVSNLIAKSPTTSVEKDKSVAMEMVPSPSKSPKSNHRNSNGTTNSPGPSPKKAVVKPNSSKLQKSQKIKELYPQRHSGCSPSSFWDVLDKDQLSSASEFLPDLASTSDKNSLKLSSSAMKKRKSKPSEDQIESVDTSESDHPLDSTPIMSDFRESPSALKKRKYEEWRKENSPFQKTIRRHRSHESPILCNVPVDVLVRPPPEQDL